MPLQTAISDLAGDCLLFKRKRRSQTPPPMILGTFFGKKSSSEEGNRDSEANSLPKGDQHASSGRNQELFRQIPVDGYIDRIKRLAHWLAGSDGYEFPNIQLYIVEIVPHYTDQYWQFKIYLEIESCGESIPGGDSNKFFTEAEAFKDMHSQLCEEVQRRNNGTIPQHLLGFVSAPRNPEPEEVLSNVRGMTRRSNVESAKCLSKPTNASEGKAISELDASDASNAPAKNTKTVNIQASLSRQISSPHMRLGNLDGTFDCSKEAMQDIGASVRDAFPISTMIVGNDEPGSLGSLFDSKMYSISGMTRWQRIDVVNGYDEHICESRFTNLDSCPRESSLLPLGSFGEESSTARHNSPTIATFDGAFATQEFHDRIRRDMESVYDKNDTNENEFTRILETATEITKIPYDEINLEEFDLCESKLCLELQYSSKRYYRCFGKLHFEAYQSMAKAFRSPETQETDRSARIENVKRGWIHPKFPSRTKSPPASTFDDTAISSFDGGWDLSNKGQNSIGQETNNIQYQTQIPQDSLPKASRRKPTGILPSDENHQNGGKHTKRINLSESSLSMSTDLGNQAQENEILKIESEIKSCARDTLYPTAKFDVKDTLENGYYIMWLFIRNQYPHLLLKHTSEINRLQAYIEFKKHLEGEQGKEILKTTMENWCQGKPKEQWRLSNINLQDHKLMTDHSGADIYSAAFGTPKELQARASDNRIKELAKSQLGNGSYTIDMITSKRGLDLARLHVSEFDERTEVVTAEGNTRDNAMKNLETKIKCIGLVKENVEKISGQRTIEWKVEEGKLEPCSLILRKVNQYHINFRFPSVNRIEAYKKLNAYFGDESRHNTIKEQLAEAEKKGALDVPFSRNA